MPLIAVNLSCPLHASARSREVARLFDMPLAGHAVERFAVDVPDLSEDWQIGLIVGPTGSGKTAVARQAFKSQLYRATRWAADRAVIDGFGELPIPLIAQTLTAVGFSSPPSWLKPYRVLSNGEKFRCDLARAFLVNQTSSNPRHTGIVPASIETGDTSPAAGLRGAPMHPLVVFDEFTSMVDRTVAKISSAAVSKAIRGGKIARRFVAVSCHHDIASWLEPDWVIDMASQSLARGRLRRPAIRLDIRPAKREEWALFRRHHYLSGNLHRSSRCFVGSIEGRPAAFTAVLPFPHPIRFGYREHRNVCLPDYQGIGIGSAQSAFVASLYAATGKPYFSTSGHPAVIAHRSHSALWRVNRRPGRVHRISESGTTGMRDALSLNRITASFEYVGPARAKEAKDAGIVS